MGIVEDIGSVSAVQPMTRLLMSETTIPPNSPEPAKERTGETARDRRLAAVVEAFLRQVRNGGSLDPEPFLQAANDLRGDLEPLLHGVLHLEQVSEEIGPQRRNPLSPNGGSEGLPGKGAAREPGAG